MYNWQRYARYVGLPDSGLTSLRRWSIYYPGDYWMSVARWLGVIWRDEPTHAVDRSAAHWSQDRWFPEGRINLCDTLLQDINASRQALVWEDETGRDATWTYAYMRERVAALAEQLVEWGVQPGGRVGIWLPPQPGVLAAFLACASIGAIAMPMFSGHSDDVVRQRAGIASPKVWIASALGVYGGRRTNFGARLHSLGYSTIIEPCKMPQPPPGRSPVACDAATPWLLGFTSGTTGEPKGILHGHAGWLVKTWSEVVLQLDVRAHDRVCWTTDPGWGVFWWLMTGVFASGATLCMLEGKPTAERYWDFAWRQNITILGMTPTQARALRTADAHIPPLGSVRLIALTGEPCDAETWAWLQSVFPGRPIINLSGGIEVGTNFLSVFPGEDVPPSSVGGPSLGMDVDVVEGELVCRSSWPGMTLGLFNDHDRSRFMTAYFGRWNDLWRQGDLASIDADGHWFLHGRSDDVLNVGGKRISCIEIEQAAGVECAAVEHEGHLVIVIERSANADPFTISNRITTKLGRAFRPSEFLAIDALPRTASGKLLRRQLQEVQHAQA